MLGFGRLTEFFQMNKIKLLKLYLNRKNLVILIFEQKFTFSSLTTESPAPNDLQLFLRILINAAVPNLFDIFLLSCF